MNRMTRFHSSDLFASLVVFLVALPLSLGIAMASGAPLSSGLIGASIGGIVVGFLGGAPLQVSGPAAGLTVMVFGMIQSLGFSTTGYAVAFAGLIQVLSGAVGLASLARMISPALIQAMLAGIGILIVLAQSQILLGFSPSGSGLNHLRLLFERLPHSNLLAVLIGILSLILIYAWEYLGKSFPKHPLKWIPAPLFTVICGTLVASAFELGSQGLSLIQMNSSLWVRPELWGSVPKDFATTSIIVQSGLALAFVASAESLLCAIATDQLHSGAKADLNRELFGQGIGNLFSGLLGGLPITGVIVRSTANIHAGAKTRWSAILHGIWILVFATFFVGILNLIPSAVLAAVLISVGIKLLKLKEFRRSIEQGDAWVYMGTLAGVVCIDLLWGIGIGMAASLLRYKKASIQE